MPVCMHLCAIMHPTVQRIFACVRVYVCVCVHVFMYMRVRACDSASVHPCMCVHEYMRVLIEVCMHYTRMATYPCTCVYKACKRIYIYIYIHIQLQDARRRHIYETML